MSSRSFRTLTSAAFMALAVTAPLAAKAGTQQPSQSTSSLTEAAVNHSDRAAAEVLLYRWWGLFEAPDGSDREKLLPGLFSNDVSIQSAQVEANGLPAVLSVLTHLPKGELRAHHLKSLHVVALGDGRLRLDAQFIYQIQGADGRLRSGEGSYEHYLSRQSDGHLAFSRLNIRIGSPVDLPQFIPAFQRNRAKSALIAFQALLDGGSNKDWVLATLLAPQAQLRDPPLASEAKTAAASRQVVGLDDLVIALARMPTGQALVGHRLTAIDSKPLGGNRFEVQAQFEQQSDSTATGTGSGSQSRKWILIDDGQVFMKIERLL